MEPNELGRALKRSAYSPSGLAVTTSPEASSTSASRRPSWKKPCLTLQDHQQSIAVVFSPCGGGRAPTSESAPARARRQWPAAFVAIAVAELFYPQDPDKAAGDLGYDPLGWKPADEKGLKDMQNKELNNGRLAMLGTLGMLVQEILYDKAIF